MGRFGLKNRENRKWCKTGRVQILPILKRFHEIDPTKILPLNPGTKLNHCLEHRNRIKVELENTPFLGFLVGVAKLEVFEAKLDFLTGMKVVLLIEIFNSGNFENF